MQDYKRWTHSLVSKRGERRKCSVFPSRCKYTAFDEDNYVHARRER